MRGIDFSIAISALESRLNLYGVVCKICMGENTSSGAYFPNNRIRNRALVTVFGGP